MKDQIRKKASTYPDSTLNYKGEAPPTYSLAKEYESLHAGIEELSIVTEELCKRLSPLLGLEIHYECVSSPVGDNASMAIATIQLMQDRVKAVYATIQRLKETIQL